MTTIAGGPRFPEGFSGEDPGLAALERAYAAGVVALVGESCAEAAAAGRQYRVIHRLWVLQRQALERDRVVRARWFRARGRGRVREPVVDPLVAVAEEIGPALRLPAITAVGRVETAVLLAECLPGVLVALEGGQVGVRQVQVIVETWRELVGSPLRPAPDPGPPVEAVQGLAAELLERAPSVTAAQLGALARRRRAVLVRGAEEARHRAARGRRRVWVEAAEDGMARLCALLDAATAHAALDRLVSIAGRVHPEAGPPGGADEGRDRGPGWVPGRARTPGQVRADVLADLLLEGEPAGMPEHLRAIRGQVSITVPALTLLQHCATSPGDPVPGDPVLEGVAPVDVAPWNAAPGKPTSGGAMTVDVAPGGAVPGNLTSGDAVPGGGEPGEPVAGGGLPGAGGDARGDVAGGWPQVVGCAELEGYGPIPDSVAARIAATAPSWTRVLTHPLTGVVMAHDRTTYAVPADLRRWLRARDGTCRFPGCRRAAARCDLDHTVAWAEGGTTEAGNLAHLCRAHHRLKHRRGPLGRWRVEQPEQEGVLVWTSPAGRVHVSYPAQYHHPVLSSVRIPDGPLPPDSTAQQPSTAQEPSTAQGPGTAQELRLARELARFWGPAWAWNRARARGLLPDDPPPF